MPITTEHGVLETYPPIVSLSHLLECSTVDTMPTLNRILILTWLLYHQPLAVTAVEYVSLTIRYPHSCVSKCLSYPGLLDDMGSIMKCGTPYANDCYCATPAASATRASSWVTACVSTACAAGDFSQDLSAMGSIYASYCMGAGFTQPGATNWFNPAAATTGASPGSTGGAGPPPTITDVSVVTETSANSGSGQTPGKFLLSLLMIAPLVVLS